MKMTKKKLFVIALVVCALALITTGTLAWFNDSAEVTNKFYVADSDNDGTPNFSIEVKETVYDADGNKVDADSDGVYDLTDKGNTYYTVAPGDKIAKDPVVSNTGDYEQWVRVNILISRDFADQVAEAQGLTIENGKAPAIDMTQLFTGFDATLYDANESNATALTDYYIYAYYYKDVLKPGETISVFTELNIPSVFTQADMNYGTDGFQINVKADAIQSDNIAGPAYTAFTAIANWPIGTAYGA